MEVIQLDELSLGAGLVVQDMKELHPTHQQETPSIIGAVTMDTEEEEETRRKSEESWMQLYPEIKKCVIVITRPTPKTLEMFKLKEERREEEEEEEKEEEGAGRSGDPEPDCDWMKPLELDDVGDTFKSFVKKVEVKVSSRGGKPCGDVLRLRHDDVTADPAHRRHHRSRSVNNNIINNNNSESTTEHNYSVVAPPVKDEPDGETPNSQSQDAGVSPSCGQKVRDSGSSEKKKPPSIVFKKVGDDQWVLGRSKVKKEEDEGSSSNKDASQPEEKKKKKKKQWLCEQRTAKRRQSEEDVWTPELPTTKTKTRMKENSSSLQSTKRRLNACRKCAACLREDCGKCLNCLDKRKFGGPSTRRQRCQLRVCLVVETKKMKPKLLKTVEAVEERVTTATPGNRVTTTTLENTVTTATPAIPAKRVPTATPAETLNAVTTETQPQRHHQRRRQTCQKDTTEEEEETEMKKKKKKIRWWRQFGKSKAKINGERGWTRPKSKCKEEKEETEVEKKKKKKRKQWFLARRKAKRRQSEEDEWTPEPLKETEEVEKKIQEEEPKKETQTPQFPAFTLVSGTGELLDGTHIQLNLTLDGSHFTPSILSDSALNSLSALLPQEGLVLHMSTDLTYTAPPAAPPSLQPLLLQPKEEEEAVDIDEYEKTGGQREDGGMMEEEEEEEEAAGGMKEEEKCGEGVTEKGKYYEIEVEVPGLDSDEETLTEASSLPETTEVANDVTAKVTDDVTAHDPPERISLSSGSFSLLGGGSGGGDEVTCGRGLFRLLRELRRTVLPAHWVAVLADGPLLQLLQCSKLSSMLSTIIHIQPDLCFFITVQNRLLPDTHTLYRTHTHRITHLSQLVSLLLELEGLVVCRGSRVRSCLLLVAPPCLTCLPCLLGEDGEEDEDDEEDEEEEEEEMEEDISDRQS